MWVKRTTDVGQQASMRDRLLRFDADVDRLTLMGQRAPMGVNRRLCEIGCYGMGSFGPPNPRYVGMINGMVCVWFRDGDREGCDGVQPVTYTSFHRKRADVLNRGAYT